MDIDFRKTFLNIDFDKRLSNSDNVLVNSEIHYLQYKRGYFTRTKERLAKFNELQKKYTELVNCKRVDGLDTIFVFTEPEEKELTLGELKTLVLQQRKDLGDFDEYIRGIVTNSHLFEKPKKKGVSFFKSRLVKK
ncbi:hypothetical protein EB118_03460 [bacterium]|nr:hypothetical protein [bacterium]NDC94036.1 hypothetical protein [bacterium]NDD82722.1 hypothetical protein [bacterium]NDG29143.1 hypothetical protein [bacterium]